MTTSVCGQRGERHTGLQWYALAASYCNIVSYYFLSQAQKAQGLRVLIVTIFTSKGEGVPRNPFADYQPRLEEDMAAMRVLGVDWFYGGFEEVVFRHSVADKSICVSLHIALACFAAWFCASDANAQLVRQIGQLLQEVVRKVKCQWLVGPTAIGYHADHLLAHRACREVDVPWTSFYYDWPYCTYPALLRARLGAAHLRDSSLEEVKVQDDLLRLRTAAVLAYASQVGPIFGSPENAKKLIESDPFERILHMPSR
eukprot:TRINITY_DN22351_c0_g1_i2.p1 TRINITY_DN22351_c0_g1~~TRINITY_DN22351_c0_g1_i2.p1  ORF type:complete len:256 (+),score=38.41 TRINITY_DN22351_c0_g1_i2:80-847(+)